MRFLFVDRILELEEGHLIKGIKHITVDDPLTHSIGPQPSFISSFLGETLGQLAAWNVMKTKDFQVRPVAGILARATVHRPAFIGETLSLTSTIDNLDDTAVEYHSEAYVGEELVFSLEGALGPLLPMNTFIDEQVVRTQFSQIYRPGPSPRFVSSPLMQSSIPIHSHLGETFQFDRVSSLEPGISIQAEKRINFAAPYFPDHFPKHPVLPLTVLLECKHHLASTFLKASGMERMRLVELEKIKMKEFVQPGDVIQSELIVKRQDSASITLNIRTSLDDKRICTVDMTFLPET